MTPLDAARLYIARGWPVFPCGPDKRPLPKRGLHDASSDPAIVAEWWRQFPSALIGVPTGEAIGAVVLDIDRKNGVDGFDTLDDLDGLDAPDRIGVGILSETPMVHTRSGGLHIYFATPAGGLRNTAGNRGRGIGPGIDWRGTGGYVIVPSSGSGYRWDPRQNFKTTPLAEVPPALLPREIERIGPARPIRPATGLSPYAESAVDSACRKIIAAPAGEQEATLNGEAYSIGTLAGAGAIPANFARHALIWAGSQIRSYDPRRPWLPREIEHKVGRAFDEGMRQPREARRA